MALQRLGQDYLFYFDSGRPGAAPDGHICRRSREPLASQTLELPRRKAAPLQDPLRELRVVDGY
jgi:hypothetical protein